VPAADVDVQHLVQSLFQKYDRDHDAQLSAAELEAEPYMKGCLANSDADGNDQITPEELTDRLQKIFNGKLALMSVSCRVMNNGRLLSGATVYFVPLPELEDKLPAAGAITQDSGIGLLTLQPEDLPKNAPKVQGLMRPGLYFVEVTHPTVKIPPKYNVKTTLGQEVIPETSSDPYLIQLKL
jgi:hypothetical protein